ncbi:uncharacterized protein MONBRDRAFT_34672 [Monosiga brevicollis MX1]|uniref:Armadillo repeat-containing domain-containing protein n=1 Tax=Monosiga brevicollis TaxID=81824 RepID=A9VD94_MONBE|nr:uncharacterized protein MONBRDRAFT_34672 [Monosiga brevicollis MX1]EDQ84516.1 predicted protein [Monosiga brevicollis MX1]|eukprot:XP_001750703.1 hypothetical protein [Monosiga brevicollis MX1]
METPEDTARAVSSSANTPTPVPETDHPAVAPDGARAASARSRHFDVVDFWAQDWELNDALALITNFEGTPLERETLLNTVFLRFMPILGSQTMTNARPATALRALYQAMDRYRDDAACLRHCINSLCAYSTVHANVLPLVESRTHVYVVRAMHAHSSDAELVQMSLATLSNLALHKLTTEILVKDGVAEAVIAVSGHHEDKTPILECAITCLANLANTRQEVVARTLLDCQAHALALRLLEQDTTIDVLFHAALCLTNLSVCPATHRILIQYRVPAALIRVLRAKPEHVALAENVLGLLARLAQRGHISEYMTTDQLQVSPVRAKPRKQHCKQAHLVLLRALRVFRERRADFNASLVAACRRHDEHVTNAYVKVWFLLLRCTTRSSLTDICPHLWIASIISWTAKRQCHHFTLPYLKGLSKSSKPCSPAAPRLCLDFFNG